MAPERPRSPWQAKTSSLPPTSPTSPQAPASRIAQLPSAPRIQPAAPAARRSGTAPLPVRALPEPPPTAAAPLAPDNSGRVEDQPATLDVDAAPAPEAAAGGASLPAGPGTPAARPTDAGMPPAPSEPYAAFPPNAHPAIREPIRSQRGDDLNGSWEIQNVISSTSYPAYRGLRLTYRIKLHQDGERIFGDGEKWAENGRRIPAAQRTPIHVSGELVGREVRVRFTERGNRRDSSGDFRWRLSADGTTFTGTFASSAADSRGASAAVRLP